MQMTGKDSPIRFVRLISEKTIEEKTMSINIPENKAVCSASKKLPCVILVDTSSSMCEDQNSLISGLKELKDSIVNDEKANSTVEVCIISFNDHAKVEEVFGPPEVMNIPSVQCSGMTAMHEAVALGIDVIDKRRREYRELGISSYRPWMYMLTDGGANDSDNGSFNKLVERQKAGKLNFFPVAIGKKVDEKTLFSLRPDHMIFSIDRENITGAFEWLSDSLSSVSSIHAGSTTLAAPQEYDISARQLQIDV